MTDTSELVRRLRFWMPIGSKHLEEDLAAAADRLEALEAALRKIWIETRDMDDQLLAHIHSTARAALKGET